MPTRMYKRRYRKSWSIYFKPGFSFPRTMRCTLIWSHNLNYCYLGRNWMSKFKCLYHTKKFVLQTLEHRLIFLVFGWLCNLCQFFFFGWLWSLICIKVYICMCSYIVHSTNSVEISVKLQSSPKNSPNKGFRWICDGDWW